LGLIKKTRLIAQTGFNIAGFTQQYTYLAWAQWCIWWCIFVFFI